jgi:hypothetical protein
MFCVPVAERVFWRSQTCTVWVGYDEAGALVFSGLDCQHLDGYEYDVTVAPGQFDALRRVLGADPAADVVELVCATAGEIMARGERTWLDEHGIQNEFGCY